MENVPNISSEEELLALRDEGKISEAEYQDLLIAMSNLHPNSAGESATTETNRTISKNVIYDTFSSDRFVDCSSFCCTTMRYFAACGIWH